MSVGESHTPARGSQLAGLFALALLFPVLHIAHATGLRNSLAAIIAIWALVIFARRRERPPLAAPVIAWLGIGIASSWWSLDAESTLKSALSDIAMPMGAFYAAFLTSREPRAFRVLTLGAACSTLILAVLTIVALAAGSMASLQSEGQEGLIYYYPGPGVTSTLSVYALPFALLLITARERPVRNAGFLSLACLLISGAGTLNRMFWPSFVVTLAAFTLWQWPRLSTPQRGWVCAGLAAVGLAAVGIVLYLNEVRGSPSNGHGMRLQALREWSASASETPLLGRGLGRKMLPQVAANSLSPALATDRYWRSHGHNLFLNVVLQVGIVGLALFLALLGSLISRAYRARDPARLGTSAALISLVVAMLTKNLTDDFMTQAAVVAFWGYAGVLLGRLACAITDPAWRQDAENGTSALHLQRTVPPGKQRRT